MGRVRNPATFIAKLHDFIKSWPLGIMEVCRQEAERLRVRIWVGDTKEIRTSGKNRADTGMNYERLGNMHRSRFKEKRELKPPSLTQKTSPIHKNLKRKKIVFSNGVSVCIKSILRVCSCPTINGKHVKTH